MEVPFVHLHCHSHYSLLDGAGKIKDLVKRAKDLGMPALALTDHGNLYGALEFYQEAAKQGIKPIIGYEAYMAHGNRTDKSADSKKKAYSHLTLLAQNYTGYKNLLKLASVANLEGFYYKPRIDKEVLEQYNDGLLCLSGCASSEIARLIVAENFDKAKEIALWYRQLFGDRYYFEIQDHGLEFQKTILEGIRKLAGELKIPMVATNDVHYINAEDDDKQDMLRCVGRVELYKGLKEKQRKDPEKYSDQYFLKNGKEMQRAMPGYEDAITRTVEIADRVNIVIEAVDLKKRFFPVFIPPDGLSADEYLRQLCLEGLMKRYAGNPKRLINGQLSDEVLARLDRELSVITKLGFIEYFLIVWDIVREAEELGIHRTARGSGVGALVCYALNMSHVCPLEFELLFERFLDENRVEAPDIDIDFDQDRRGEIFDYITKTYGKENVARLGTFGTMGAKMSIKDVGRALELPIPFVADVTKLIPDKPGTEIDHALNGKKNKETGEIEVSPNEELKKRLVQEPPLKELIDYAQKIEGLARNTGVHACGVIIADKPLTEYVPLQLDKKEVIVTQWEGKDVEAAGLLKMDILGLQNLTILAHSIDLIKETTGTTIDPYRLPLEDKKTFELLCRGETKGIFQLEGGGMRELLQRMKPDRFRDIIATIALYRPGPLEGGMVDQYVAVKHGKTKAEYVHPVLQEVLGETNGVMIYQEQIMQIMNRLGNIPLAGSYASIKAISKKKDLGKYREQFVKGAKANGLTEKKANDIFELIVKFSDYGFNKSHSTAYAMVAYMTAYLKAHYPVEFMAALLCGDISRRNFSSKDSTVEHIEDCERMGIKIIPPDVNTSKQLYSVVDGKIIFALTAIKSCGDWAADKIVEAREKDGKFKDLFDFCGRVDNRACNRAAIEALIKAGAFDSLEQKRSQLMQMIEIAVKAGQGAAEDAAKGQGSLFGGDEEPATTTPKGLPTIPEWTDKEKSSYEKDVLGFYLSSHPLQEFTEVFTMFRSHECAEAVILPDKTQVVLAGVVNDIKIAAGKNPKPDKPNTYAMFTLEDASGSVRSIMWSEAYDKFSPLIKSDSIVFMRGRMDRSRSAETSAEMVSPDGNFIVDEAFTIDEAPKKLCRGLAIALNEQLHSTASVDALMKMLQDSPGSEPVELSLRLREGTTAIFRGGKTTVGVTPALFRRITDLLGTDSAKVLIKPPPVKKSYRT